MLSWVQLWAHNTRDRNCGMKLLTVFDEIVNFDRIRVIEQHLLHTTSLKKRKMSARELGYHIRSRVNLFDGRSDLVVQSIEQTRNSAKAKRRSGGHGQKMERWESSTAPSENGWFQLFNVFKQ
jgi:hypothetical protein